MKPFKDFVQEGLAQAGGRVKYNEDGTVSHRIDVVGKGREKEVHAEMSKDHKVVSVKRVGKARVKGVPDDTHTYEIVTKV